MTWTLKALATGELVEVHDPKRVTAMQAERDEFGVRRYWLVGFTVEAT